MHIFLWSYGNVSVGILVNMSVYVYLCSSMYICVDLYMCMNVNVHVCPTHLRTYCIDALYDCLQICEDTTGVEVRRFIVVVAARATYVHDSLHCQPPGWPCG